MNTRIALIALLTLGLSLTGCAYETHTGMKVQQAPEMVPPDVVFTAPATLFEYNKTYEFDRPMQLRVEYPRQGHEQPVAYDAIVIPLSDDPDDPYTLTFQYDANMHPDPILVVNNGAVYAVTSGTQVTIAVAGRQTGVYGDGTIVILEATKAGDEYVYLLKGTYARPFRREGRLTYPNTDVTVPGQFSACRVVNGTLQVDPPGPIVGDRSEIRRRLVNLAQMAGLGLP